MTTTSPVLIAVAPNGARRTQVDHLALPITPDEIACTAAACVDAGAAMLHLHVRDDQGRHSLDPWRYEKAIMAVKASVGDNLLIQVSSEAAGKFNAAQQMASIESLMPEYVSLGLRGYIADETAVEEGAIPGDQHLLLFVLGRYGKQFAHARELPAYIEALQRPSHWMVCAFGPNELAVMAETIKLGGHCRVGFENNFELRKGVTVAGNEDLVAVTADLIREQNCALADVATARRLHIV